VLWSVFVESTRRRGGEGGLSCDVKENKQEKGGKKKEIKEDAERYNPCLVYCTQTFT